MPYQKWLTKVAKSTIQYGKIEYFNMEKLNITTDAVIKKPDCLNINISPGPDGIRR